MQARLDLEVNVARTEKNVKSFGDAWSRRPRAWRIDLQRKREYANLFIYLENQLRS
jgi:hypothetical protein